MYDCRDCLWAFLALKAAKRYDAEEEKRKRQYEVFYTLMKTRRLPLVQERVGALNSIQLNFYGVEVIADAYKRYIDHLDTTAPSEPAQVQKFLENRDDFFYDLLFQIGHFLRFSFDKRDMQKLAYLPEGWNTDEQIAKNFRRLVIELLDGRRGLPVERFRANQLNDKFPPPP